MPPCENVSGKCTNCVHTVDCSRYMPVCVLGMATITICIIYNIVSTAVVHQSSSSSSAAVATVPYGTIWIWNTKFCVQSVQCLRTLILHTHRMNIWVWHCDACKLRTPLRLERVSISVFSFVHICILVRWVWQPFGGGCCPWYCLQLTIIHFEHFTQTLTNLHNFFDKFRCRQSGNKKVAKPWTRVSVWLAMLTMYSWKYMIARICPLKTEQPKCSLFANAMCVHNWLPSRSSRPMDSEYSMECNK